VVFRPRDARPSKVVLDLAVTIALGGYCLADLAVVRAQPALFGQVASDPTVSRLIDALAGDADAALAGLRTLRAPARERVRAESRPVGDDWPVASGVELRRHGRGP
jgi:hypothetical protein